jgi:signal transduction histidine kinase
LSKLVESARGLDATDPGWCLEEVGTGDELDLLGRAFNDLLSRLHLAYERQQRFSSDASHQLRTPLTVLIGQIEVALRQERPADEYRRVLKSALGRAKELARIVESLLFLAKAETDATLPDREYLELNRWVAEHLASRAAIDLAPEVVHSAAGSDLLWVQAHSALLGQLVDNLLDNARKYSQPNARILVETLRHREEVILAVEDAGPGIPAADLAHVFEPFYRSAQARGQGLPGVGLGLAVVRRIAMALGGSVALASELGKGSRFEVHLPMVQPHETTGEDSERITLATHSSPIGCQADVGSCGGA